MNKHDEEQKNESAVTDAQEMINVLSDLYDKEVSNRTIPTERFSTNQFSNSILAGWRDWMGQADSRIYWSPTQRSNAIASSELGGDPNFDVGI